MAVTKTVVSATPYEKDGDVVRWFINMQYEDGEDNTYLSNTFTHIVDSVTPDNKEVFDEKTKGEWTLAELIELCPVDHWDNAFAAQYDSLITNPPVNPEPDDDFELPES